MIVRMSIASLFLFTCFRSTASPQIAPGVQQSAAQTATIIGSLVQSDGTPVTGASVRLSGPGAQRTTQSDGHGTFVFINVPYGTYTIAATAANLGTTKPNTIVVKGDINVAIQYGGQAAGGLKEIAHVSTQSAGASINVTPASIASVTPSDYAFQGNTSWIQLLDQIPGVTVGGDLLEGRAVSVDIPNTPFYPVVLSINGAQPYETSVTLDGMPLASQSVNTMPGSGADLSYLPMSTFETADVVRGPGADAPSIVDSIGGSFVLHAPGAVEKNAYEFSLSNDAYGGMVANAKVALHFGRLSALITYGVDNSPGPLEGGASPLVTIGNPSTVNGQAFTGTASSPLFSFNTNPFSGVRGTLLKVGGSDSSAWTQHNGSIALSYSVTPSITAEVFYAGTSSVWDGGNFLCQFNFIPASGYTGSLTPGENYPQSANNLSPFYQSASLLEEKVTAYIGGGVLRLAALQNNSFDQLPAVSQSSGYSTLYGSGCITPGSGTGGCPTGFAPVIYNGTSEYITVSPSSGNEYQWSNNRDLLLSYAQQMGSRSSLSLSYVVSYYDDPKLFTYSQPGCFYQSINTPSAISETTNELRLHVTSEISNKFSLDASWYIARGTYHVPDPTVSNCIFSSPSAVPGYLFASITSPPSAYKDSLFSYSEPRLGATWRANSNIMIRASGGGGFALPPLASLIGSSGPPTCSAGICTQSLTNLNLHPEKSFGFDLGTDMRLHHDTVLSFDLYRANLYGQFYSSASAPVACSTEPTCPAGNGASPLYITQEGNLSQSVMEGINIDIHHDVPRGIYWHGALGLTRGYVVNVPAGFYNDNTCPTTPCANQYIVPGQNFNGYFQSTVPYANGSATIGYRWAPRKYVDLSPTYYGNNNAYYRPAFVEFDAHAGYPLTKNVSLLATFKNITGIYNGSQNILFSNSFIAPPVIPGALQEPYGLYAQNFGPRSIIVTISVH